MEWCIDHQVIEVLSYWGFLALVAKENVYLAPTLRREIKKSFDGGMKDLPKALNAYIGEVALSTNPTRSILGNNALDCCVVALAT